MDRAGQQRPLLYTAALPSMALVREAIQRDHAKKPKHARLIFYGANTCWWSHDNHHLSTTPPPPQSRIRSLAETLRANSSRPDAPIGEFFRRAQATYHRLPCDPLGGVLMQTDNVEEFLTSAEANPTHYGRHGILAFLAAHHLNCVDSVTRRPSAATEWEEYNRAIDRYLEAQRHG